jgi:asparagine synthase (glutamine-hydrolysing)
MCGICGMTSTTGEAVMPETIAAMAATMRHRGPDDCGEWVSADGRVAFGHRRLSIIDLSPAGRQPMVDATGTLTVTFNGEIYNFAELRAQLAAAGHRFWTATDTEVILEAYRRWDTDCVQHFRGMFAFAVHDATRKRIFLARDRAGEKPLFYSHCNGRLAFASELKAMMTIPGFARTVDPDALNSYLAYGYVAGAHSIFKGVTKLQQGHAATLDLESDELKVWPYWQLPDRQDDVAATDDELVEELHAMLLGSVRRQLVADVPVGVMLSGGLDSSLIAAMAASASSKPVKTFNISFPGHADLDEAPFARLVARHLATDHTELAAEAATVDLLPALAKQFDEPLGDSSLVPTYLVSRLIRQHATVALGGDGGDELFGGYIHYDWVRRQELVRRVAPAPLRSTMSAAAKLIPVGVRGRNYLRGVSGNVDWSLTSANQFFDVDWRRRLLAPSGIFPDQLPENLKVALAHGSSATGRSMAVDFRSYLVDDILVKVDRASMLASLEVRAPLLDAPIIEFAFGRVPDHLRNWKGERKVILRRLAKRLLPPQLDVTRKQGFALPLDAWFRGNWGSYMCEVLSQADPQIFDRRTIDSIVAGQRKGRLNSHRVFALTMFELWRREYKATL